MVRSCGSCSLVFVSDTIRCMHAVLLFQVSLSSACLRVCGNKWQKIVHLFETGTPSSGSYHSLLVFLHTSVVHHRDLLCMFVVQPAISIPASVLRRRPAQRLPHHQVRRRCCSAARGGADREENERQEDKPEVEGGEGDKGGSERGRGEGRGHVRRTTGNSQGLLLSVCYPA